MESTLSRCGPTAPKSIRSIRPKAHNALAPGGSLFVGSAYRTPTRLKMQVPPDLAPTNALREFLAYLRLSCRMSNQGSRSELAAVGVTILVCRLVV